LYNLAEAFAFPSIYEEFGIPVVEAMSCGCPVAGANTGNIPYLLGDAGLLSDPQRPEELAHGLLSVLGSPDTARSLAQRGLERAGGFSWAKSARDTLAVFRRVQQEGIAS
jgi:alpha-1,3-rhamnosyl/mannosyltransferase